MALTKENVLMFSKMEAAEWLHPIPYYHEHVGNVMWDFESDRRNGSETST